MAISIVRLPPLTHGFFESRLVLMHPCQNATSQLHLCSLTSEKTACIHVVNGWRAHVTFHSPAWKHLGELLAKNARMAYCKAHMRWLLNYLKVLHHVAIHNSLPLSGVLSGVDRWLQRQLAFIRRRRLRLVSKSQSRCSERVLNQTQSAMLRALPRWKATGRWLNPGSLLRSAQLLRRRTQIERQRMLEEDTQSILKTRNLVELPPRFVERIGC